MTKLALIPYSDFSKGGRALAEAMGVRFARRSRGYFNTRGLEKPMDVVMINWGWSNNPVGRMANPVKVFNPFRSVSICGNKLTFFRTVKDKVRIPEFTEDFGEAMDWVDKGEVVMGRDTRGTCGLDIRWIEDDLSDFSNSKFWVKYKKKETEFRVHVAFGEVIDVQKKALRKTAPDGSMIDTSNVDFRVRNLRNGFVFVRNDITVPDDVYTQALAAVKEAGLDFGAVDVIYNATEGKAYVLEINTAPGLQGSTIDSYAKAFAPQIKQYQPQNEMPF